MKYVIASDLLHEQTYVNNGIKSGFGTGLDDLELDLEGLINGEGGIQF